METYLSLNEIRPKAVYREIDYLSSESSEEGAVHFWKQ